MKSFRSTHTIITLVIAGLLVGLFAVGYGNLVEPNTKQAEKYDAERRGHFADISRTIQSYYIDKNRLPDNLPELQDWYYLKKQSDSASTDLGILGSLLDIGSGITLRDPYSNKPYEYKVQNTSGDTYQLCTTFFKDYKLDENKAKNSSSNDVVLMHDKGNYCVELKVKKKVNSTNSSSNSSSSSGVINDGNNTPNDVRNNVDVPSSSQQQLLQDIERSTSNP